MAVSGTRRRRWGALALVIGLSGCGKVASSEAAVDAGETGDDGTAIDGGGEVDAGGDGATCEPGAPLRCAGGALVVCDEDGAGEARIDCGLRCDAEALACQEQIEPSNGLAAALDAAETAPALIIPDDGVVASFDTGVTVDPETGTVIVAGQAVPASVVAQPGGPELLALSVRGLLMEEGAQLNVQGVRALAIVSWTEARIDGRLFVTAGSSRRAQEDCWGRTAGSGGIDGDVGGGGGGSFGGTGGGGGQVRGTQQAIGGAGGAPTGSEALAPLRAGCPGGTDGVGSAGSGGGAIQIVSGTAIQLGGQLAASGGGGSVGSGGGSGGGILLEAPVVQVSGGVFANGGSGGCGDFSSGAPGGLTTEPAPGAVCGTAGTADAGGDGGALAAEVGPGGDAENRALAVDRAGGGGGGVGRIRVNTVDGSLGPSGVFSPGPSLGQVAGR